MTWLIGGGIFIGLALIANADGTVQLVAAVLSIRGLTFICKKVADSMDKDNGQIIDMTGWSLSGIPIIGLIKYAMQGIRPVTASIQTVSGGLTKFAAWIDKIVFWN